MANFHIPTVQTVRLDVNSPGLDRELKTTLPRPGKPKDRKRITVRITHLEIAPGGNREVLLAVYLIRNGRSIDAGAQVVAPDAISGPRVECVEPAIAFAHEHKISGRRQHPADQGLRSLVLPGDLPGLDIQRDEGSILNPAGRHIRERAPEADQTRRTLRGLRRKVHQLVHCHDVGDPQAIQRREAAVILGIQWGRLRMSSTQAFTLDRASAKRATESEVRQIYKCVAAVQYRIAERVFK